MYNQAGRNTLLPASYQLLVFKNNILFERVNMDSKNERLIKNGLCATKYEYLSDDLSKFIKSWSYYDDNNQAINSNRGYHRIEVERDKKGNMLQTKYFDKNKLPISNYRGVHCEKNTLNDKGKVIAKEFFSSDNTKATDFYGVHKYEYQVSKSLILKENRFDSEYKAVRNSSDAAHVIRHQYDDNGNRILSSFFNTEDVKINNSSGYHILQNSYSSNNMLETTIYLDLNNKPVKDNRGIHKYFYVRDQYNRITITAYFGTGGEPVKDNANQVYMEKNKYDEKANLISVSFWQTDSEKMNRWSNIHEYRYEYNNEGLLITESSYDKNGNLKKETFGRSRTENKYSENGERIEMSNFDGNKPVNIASRLCIAGYHRIVYENYKNGSRKEISYFNKDNIPVNVSICEIGNAHRIEFIYNGHILKEQRLYKKSSSVPSKVINCQVDKYVNSYGNSPTKKF